QIQSTWSLSSRRDDPRPDRNRGPEPEIGALMSLIDEARAIARANQRGPLCRIAQLLEAHPEVKDELEEALAEPMLTGTAIAAALKSRYGDDAPTAQTVNRHRKGECNCGSQ